MGKGRGRHCGGLLLREPPFSREQNGPQSREVIFSNPRSRCPSAKLMKGCSPAPLVARDSKAHGPHAPQVARRTAQSGLLLCQSAQPLQANPSFGSRQRASQTHQAWDDAARTALENARVLPMDCAEVQRGRAQPHCSIFTGMLLRMGTRCRMSLLDVPTRATTHSSCLHPLPTT